MVQITTVRTVLSAVGTRRRLVIKEDIRELPFFIIEFYRCYLHCSKRNVSE